MRNIKVILEYDGTDFYGFQYQPGVPTIQGELEKALSKIFKERITVYGSGRTDAGVHALGQVINFRSHGTIPIDRVCVAMNSLLPPSIAAISACEVDEHFHARYSAKSRLYRYVILNRSVRSAIQGRFCWHVPQQLDLLAMSEAAQCLVGVHDFAAFAAADRDEKDSSVRNVMHVSLERQGDNVIFDIRANAFLRSMVRSIVGTLVEIGVGKRSVSEMREILESRDRRAAGKTAPPQGLFLVEVEY
ncbi:MAG: tRNA pseudouridine(38-40) synthase TruA [Armatimonadota bacterium]|nr:tRNA pseudouridine(38-40) synthase TruA [Armatimonadota bacterium]